MKDNRISVYIDAEEPFIATSLDGAFELDVKSERHLWEKKPHRAVLHFPSSGTYKIMVTYQDKCTDCPPQIVEIDTEKIWNEQTSRHQ